MIESIVFPIIVLVAAGGGVYLGHYVTLRGVAHVQPSSEKMIFDIKGETETEPDPWDQALYGEPLDETAGPDEQHAQDSAVDKMHEMGLNTDEMESYMAGTSLGAHTRQFQGIKPVEKAEVNMTGPDAGGIPDEA